MSRGQQPSGSSVRAAVCGPDPGQEKGQGCNWAQDLLMQEVACQMLPSSPHDVPAPAPPLRSILAQHLSPNCPTEASSIPQVEEASRIGSFLAGCSRACIGTVTLQHGSF